MNTKIIAIIIVSTIIVSAGACWFLGIDKETDKKETTALEEYEPISLIDLSNSGLDAVDLPNINFDLGFDLEALNMDLGAANPLSVPNADGLEMPTIPSMTDFTFEGGSFGGHSGGSTPPPGYKPDAATCAQFSAAPSCEYVPANVRDLCEQCKE